jgi:hypothetical protein
MAENRRKKKRRSSDQILNETIQVLRTLERISKGEEADFSEYFVDLVGMKDRIGRREEDRKLGEALCSAIESIASNIGKLLEREKSLRHVRITKMGGKKGAKLAVETAILGWEEDRPQIGKNYRVFKEDGGVFRSAVVTKVTDDQFHTVNSLYRLEVLQEG